MNSAARKVIAAVLSAAALGFAAQASQAATVAILGGDAYDDFGGSLGVPFPGYGTGSSQNNVVNSGFSILTDPTGGAAWRLNATVYSNITPYSVDWWYVGSESGHQTTFYAPTAVPTASYTEPAIGNGDKNNSLSAPTATGAISAGSSSGVAAIIDFTAKDLTSGVFVTNGLNAIPGPGVPSLIFAYAKDVIFDSFGIPTAAVLTTVATDWFVFGFNDNGFDDNHDDIMGLAHVTCPTGVACGSTQVVPLPPAILLFGTALAGMGLLGVRRRRRVRAVF